MPKLNIDLSQVVTYLRQNAGKKHLKDMEAELGLSITFIRKVAASQDISLFYMKPKVKEKIDAIQEMLESGKNPYQIARKLGIYYSHVNYLAEKYIGVKPRKREARERPERETQFFNAHARENWLV
jgi:hypothetical protein